MNARAGWLAASATGLLWWALAASMSDKSEPWDSSLYWIVFYPLAVMLSLVLGALFSERPWRWALAVMLAQVPVMMAGGAGFSMLPLGVVLILILTLPAIAAASLGAALRRRFARA